MCCQNKSGSLYLRQYEWIGDAYLSFQIKKVLIRRYPNTSMRVINGNVGKLVSNKILTQFGKLKNLGNGNHVEILLGRLSDNGDFDLANELIDEFITFGINATKVKFDYQPVAAYSFPSVSPKKHIKFKIDFDFLDKLDNIKI